ncbi:MAG: B12-binding domain-containing radical SAM protein [Spirochaetales bacterium]|nr:B12-binding domain-containing radical SAM protein [Spirochaetales bacterium]
MKILLIYPEFPVTHWNFKHVLKLVAKKATEPPLGLITVASMLPKDWERKLVDMNVGRLKDSDIEWADMVFISGMIIQKKSFDQTVQRCKKLGVRVVAGGPMVTEQPENYPEPDHLILNEAEITLLPFLEDLTAGNPKRVYSSDVFPDITSTPIPDWSLLDMKRYVTMDLQYSRGCPFNCEFCSITALFGHRPRVKTAQQFIAELESLYNAGWCGHVFIVDDNFIGNKRYLKSDLLPGIIEWQKAHGYPFSFNTEVSINLADDEELMDLMADSGFTACFVGIETPDDESLSECGKTQNRGINMIDSVKRMQRKGLNVSAGFIVGFDSDDEDIFERQFNFIQKSGIVNAMVGLLSAPFGTRLYKRLEAENRIIEDPSGDNVDGSLNFKPKMNPDILIRNYKSLVKKIYSPKYFMERLATFLLEYKISDIKFGKSNKNIVSTAVRVFLRLGIFQSKGKRCFWKTIRTTITKYPKKITTAVTLLVYGLHFRKVADKL